MNRKIGNRITSFVLVLLMVCSTVSNTGLTAFAETSDGNAPMESVDFTDGSDIGADTVDNTVTNPADETSATLVDSETAAALSAVKVLAYATDEENITDAYLGIALTGETAFEEVSTLSCHVMDDQERASYTESLQSELDNDETKTRQVSIVKSFDLGVLTSNHPVQKTFDTSMMVRMYLPNADALSDTALYVCDENQAWHEVPFEVYDNSDDADETESKVAHGLSYIQCSTNQLGTFAFAKVSETDKDVDTDVVSEPDDSIYESEPVYEAKTYVYEDDDVRITAETTAEAKIASDAVLCAKKLTGESYEKAWKQVSDAYPLEAGQELVYVPYDVYFTVDDGKVEPEAGLVKVSMTYKSKHMGVELDDTQTVAEVKAGHICEDGRVEILDNSAKKESVVTFDVSSFSPMGGIMVLASNPVNNVYWWYDGSKTTLHLSNKAETNAYRLFTSGQPWSGYREKITQVVLDTEIQPTCTASWFNGCKALTSLDFGDKLNTVDVTDMHQMFDFCESLKSLNLGSKFDTSHVTNTNTMFGGCQSLESLDLGNKFDTSSVTDMGSMFQSCIALKSLRLGDKFNTSSVIDMSYLFSNCSNLQQLDLGSQFDTSSAVSMEAMFNGCSSLEELNLGSRFDTSNVTNMYGMFTNCSALLSLDLGDNFDTSRVQTMVSTFYGCTSLKSLRLGDKFYTGNVTNMYGMFTNCSALSSLDLGDNFDTGKVTNFFGMFFGCSSMTSLDMGDKFDTSLATNVRWMFKNCNALQKLVSQKAGRQDIELPLKMIEQDSQDGIVYSVMPSGSKILVPFTLSVAENITSTTVVMRKSMDKRFENVPIFEFGVYKEDGTLVDTVKNDKDGNIVIETKDYALGRYYVQEKAGTGANIIYDTSKYYFTVSEVQEKVTGVHVSHESNQVTYYTPVESSLLTGGNLQLSGFSGVTVTDSEGKTHTLRAYCANVSKHSPHGTAKQVYINPTDAEINEARGDVYTGPQENLSDAIRCILYFENDNAQQRIWDLLNRGAVIDTSRVNEIPAEFQFAIITPPSFDMQPLIVPLADIRVVSTEDKDVMEDITTGIVKKRVVTLETPVSVFENRTSSKTYVIKQDEDGNVLYGAKLSLWKDGELVRSFTTTAATFGEMLADGDYILREDEAPDGYEKAADISFQVKDHVAYQNGVAVSENTIVMIDKAIRRLTTLTISKKVTGSFGDKYKDFKFYLTLDDDSITSLSYMKGDATETVTRNADNQFEFTLSHGESVVFADLPVGTGYIVTEPDAKAEGYEVTADGATGTIQENGSTVLFTNNRNMVVPTELDTNMAVFGMILAAGCVLLIGYCFKRRKK